MRETQTCACLFFHAGPTLGKGQGRAGQGGWGWGKKRKKKGEGQGDVWKLEGGRDTCMHACMQGTPPSPISLLL